MSNLAYKLTSNSDFCLVGEDLVSSNLGLIRSVVSKFVKGEHILDSDLYSIACIAMIEATKTFDPLKSKFSTWATRRMTQAILDQLRKNKKNLSKLVISELDETEQNKALACEASTEISSKLICLTKPSIKDSDEKKMLMLHYLEEKSLSEIAKEFGFTKEGVRKKIKKAIIQIRNQNKNLLKDYF